MKIYECIQDAGDEIFGGNYGCQLIKGSNLDSLRKLFPNGRFVETYSGNYWLWSDNGIKNNENKQY